MFLARVWRRRSGESLMDGPCAWGPELLPLPRKVSKSSLDWKDISGVLEI